MPTSSASPASAGAPARSVPGDRLGTLDRLVAGALRRLRSLPTGSIGETARRQERAYERALMVIRAYYLFGVVLLVYETGQWLPLRRSATIDPLWPARWLDETSPQRGIDAVLIAFSVATVVAAVLPRSRLARAAFSLALLQYLSVKFGFGKINHGFHAWLFTSVAFVLLPAAPAWRRPTPAMRRLVLQIVWSAQVVLLFTYTLTGMWKLWYAVDAVLFSDRIGAFHPRGFSLLIAEDLVITGRKTLLGVTLVEQYRVGWLLFNGTIFLQVTSLLAALRPRLHRLWGAGLIAFHLGTQLAMGFTFVANIVLLGLLLVCSPWAPDEVRVREVVADVPFVRLALRTWGRFRSRPALRGAAS